MNNRFRWQLTITLIIFSLFLSILIAIFDYQKLDDRVRVSQQEIIQMAEDKIIDSFTTIEKVYHLIDQPLVKEMEAYSTDLLQLYEEQPDFSTWDFQKLKHSYGMDVFIIDKQNIVRFASFEPDVGLDFNACCPIFAELLNERRAGESFTHDDLDIQTKTGELKKFSYLPTPDHQYIIELAVTIDEEPIFEQFNFLETIIQLEREFDTIESIRVYNFEGYMLGSKMVNNDFYRVSPEQRQFFQEILTSKQTVEHSFKENEHPYTARYIPYQLNEKKNVTSDRVVEIVYNDVELSSLLRDYREEFFIQLLVIIITTVALSFIIAGIVSKPIYLAFHDSLTNMYNRAAFETTITKELGKKNSNVVLMMIDLDNFKLVNDQYGHMKGDKILQLVSVIIKRYVGQSAIPARIGGDEFVVLFKNVTEEEVRRRAITLIQSINEELNHFNESIINGVSMSIGIAFSNEADDLATLYQKADQALYHSKNNGKNQYSFYHQMTKSSPS